MKMAISVDQLGNVTCVSVFNRILVRDRLCDKKTGLMRSFERFGNPDETISSVLGKNKIAGTLTWLGRAIAWILDKIDDNHCVKSIGY